MSRGEHHRIHAHDRLRRNRLRIAQEAARLMSEHGIRDFQRHTVLRRRCVHATACSARR